MDAADNAIPESKQDNVFANIIRSLKKDQWRRLISCLERSGYRANHRELAEIVGRRLYAQNNPDPQDVILAAIVNNLCPALRRLHSPESTLLRGAARALRDGQIVILDVSMLAGTDARLIAAWLLNGLFQNNQRAYSLQLDPSTASRPKLIPCLTAFEEAQFYLGDSNLREDSPFVRWFKEGRKFSLGSILVTQQPGAIGPELISQCDNFFAFHLLSRADLDSLERANLHYSGDIATAIGHEPIPGNCFLWSSRGLSFVTCARILHFRDLAGSSAAQSPGPEARNVPAATPPEVSNVSLPVRELPSGPHSPDAYLLGIVKRVIEEHPQLFIFGVSSLEPGVPEIPCEALITVSAQFLASHSAGAVLRDIQAGNINRDVRPQILDQSGFPTVHPDALVRCLRESDLVPPVFLASSERYGEMILLRRAALDLRKKPDLRGARALPLRGGSSS
ncbi:ATP-binding protein [Candidatus Poribacteria bacterium]|nr:ATP-binding protein [Candidatus Poribacteria bacterium]